MASNQDELRILVTAAVKDAVADLGDVEKKIGGVGKSAERLTAQAQRVGQTMSRAVTLPLLGAAGAAVKFAADIERQQVALKVLLGSAEEASAIFKEWQQFAASTPFQLEDITNAGKSLIAFGENADEVTETLRRIGDVSAGIGAPLGEIAEIYGKARVQQTLFAEDINQLAGRGIPIFTGLAEVLGVAESEVKALASQGRVSFGDLEQVFANLTKEGGQFAGMMSELSETTAGKFSTAMDNLKTAAAGLGAEMLPMVSDVLDEITSAAQWFGELDETTKRLILTVGGAAAAAGPLISAVSRTVQVVNILKPAVIGLNAAMMANPAVAVAAALAGLAAVAGGILIRSSRRAAKEQDELAESINKTADAAERITGSFAESEPIFNRLRLSQFEPLERVLADLIDGSDTWTQQVGVLEGQIEGLGESIALASRRIESGETGLTPAVERATDFLALLRAEVASLKEEFGENEEQERYNELLNELNQEWEWAAQKAVIFGDEFNLVNEQLKLYEGFIEDAIEAGVSLDNQDFQQLIAQYYALKQAADETAEAMRIEIAEQDYQFDALLTGLEDAVEEGERMWSEADWENPFGPTTLNLTGFAEDLAEGFALVMDIGDATRAWEADQAQVNREIDRSVTGAWWLAEAFQAGFAAAESMAEAMERMRALEEFKFELADSVTEGIIRGLENADLSELGNSLTDWIRSVLPPIMGDAIAFILGQLGKGIGRNGDAGNDYMLSVLDPIVDAEREMAEQRVEILEEQLRQELELRNDHIEDLKREFDTEFDVLRDQWERNLIDTEEFRRRTRELNEAYDAGEAAADAPVEDARDDLADYQAYLDAIDSLESQIAAEQAYLDSLGLLQLGEKKRTRDRIGDLADQLMRLMDAGPEGYSTSGSLPGGVISEILSAAGGADFVTSGPQLMLVGDNPSGRERVRVSPLDRPTSDGVTIVVQGDVYGVDDLYSRLEEAGRRLSRRGRVA